MTHSHDVYDTDEFFIIDAITRNIKNISPSKTKLIQNDHNSERFTFEIPRYIEGHDVLLCDSIEVHYSNVAADEVNKSEDVYLVRDVQISPDDESVVIFSWLISGNATRYAGSLSFAIHFICLTGETVDYAWHTGVNDDITVSESIDNGERKNEIMSDIAAGIDTILDEIIALQNQYIGGEIE